MDKVRGIKNKNSYYENRAKAVKLTSSSQEDRILLECAKMDSAKAIRSSIALSLTIKVSRNNEIIAVAPDKSEIVIRKISKSTMDVSSLIKGMILERK